MQQYSAATDGWSDGTPLAIVTGGLYSIETPQPPEPPVPVPVIQYGGGGGGRTYRFDFACTPKKITGSKKKTKSWQRKRKYATVSDETVEKRGHAVAYGDLPVGTPILPEIVVVEAFDKYNYRKVLMSQIGNKVKRHIKRRWPAYALSLLAWLAEKGE